MSTPTERTANQAAVKEAIDLAANGDRGAASYLWAMATAARTLDDLVDRDEPVTDEQIVNAFFGLLVDLPLLPFFQRHRDVLTGVQLVALNAWLDANHLERRGDATAQLYAHVLRDAVNELLVAVAYLTGGFRHMRRVSLRARDLFAKPFEPQPEN